MKAVEARPEVIRADDTAPPLSIAGKPSAWRRYEPYLIGVAAVALALAVWQAVASAQLVQPLFLPGPYDIANAEVSIFRSPDIWLDLGTSGVELGAGYGLAILAGLPIGLLMGWYRRFNHALDPFISFLYATPRVALLPLLIIWFGIGVYSKIAVIFLGAFFPIAINTMAGIRSLDSSLIKAARSFGASDARLFTTVALPGSVPFILTGLRLGVGHALVGVVVGELVAAQHGIGYEMMIAGSTFQTPKVFAYLILLAGTGVVLTVLLQRIERRFDAWRPRN